MAVFISAGKSWENHCVKYLAVYGMEYFDNSILNAKTKISTNVITSELANWCWLGVKQGVRWSKASDKRQRHVKRKERADAWRQFFVCLLISFLHRIMAEAFACWKFLEFTMQSCCGQKWKTQPNNRFFHQIVRVIYFMLLCRQSKSRSSKETLISCDRVVYSNTGIWVG